MTDYLSLVPDITEEDVARLHHGPAEDYATLIDLPQDDVLDEDDHEFVAGLMLPRARTPKLALDNLHQIRLDHTSLGGVGLCWRHIRWDAWGLQALWPTAEQGGLHGAPIHRFDHFDQAPRGMTIIMENAHVWHVTMALGAGLNDTSDYHQPGFSGVATMANTYEWCGGTDWYGIEKVNDVDCWPFTTEKPQTRKKWDLARRVKFLRAESDRQRKNGHTKRADQMSWWADTLEKKIPAKR